MLNYAESFINASDDTGARAVQERDCFGSERAGHGCVMQDGIGDGMSNERAMIADQRVA